MVRLLDRVLIWSASCCFCFNWQTGFVIEFKEALNNSSVCFYWHFNINPRLCCSDWVWPAGDTLHPQSELNHHCCFIQDTQIIICIYVTVFFMPLRKHIKGQFKIKHVILLQVASQTHVWLTVSLCPPVHSCCSAPGATSGLRTPTKWPITFWRTRSTTAPRVASGVRRHTLRRQHNTRSHFNNKPLF